MLCSVQLVILSIIPRMRGLKILNGMMLLKYSVLIQFVLRMFRIYPWTLGKLGEATWAIAAFNLLLYVLASHVSLVTLMFQWCNIFFDLLFYISFLIALPGSYLRQQMSLQCFNFHHSFSKIVICVIVPSHIVHVPTTIYFSWAVSL